MVYESPNHRLVVLAATVAGGLLLAFDLTFRAVAAQVSSPVNRIPFDPAALERLPRQIGNWSGQDVPLDEAVRERTGADAIVNRRYARRNGLESAVLYIASGVSARALVDHRPEVCFISSGWTLMSRHSLELTLADGTTLPCSVFQFSRGMLDRERTTALHYYIVDGQYCGDVSLLRRKVWRGAHAVDYAARVQVVVSTGTLAPESAMELACAFVVDSAPSILRLFEDREEEPQRGGVVPNGSAGAPGED